MRKAFTIIVLCFGLFIGHKMKSISMFSDFECNQEQYNNIDEYNYRYDYDYYYHYRDNSRTDCAGYGEHSEGKIHFNVYRLSYYVLLFIIVIGLDVYLTYFYNENNRNDYDYLNIKNF